MTNHHHLVVLLAICCCLQNDNTAMAFSTLLTHHFQGTTSSRLHSSLYTSNNNPRLHTSTSDDAVEAVIKSAAAVVDLNVTGDLSAGSDKVKIELDQLTPSQVTANLNVELSGSDDSGEISIKGSNARLTVNGRLSAGQGNDALKLLVEGAAVGTPLLDGGIGQDSCSTTIGTLVACE